MKPHRTDKISLTFGLIFLTVVAWWLVAQILDLTLPTVGWFLAGGLILVGVFGLLGAILSGRTPTTGEQPGGWPASASGGDLTAAARDSARDPMPQSPRGPAGHSTAGPEYDPTGDSTGGSPYRPG